MHNHLYFKQLTELHNHFMVSWNARNNVSCYRLAVESDFLDTLAGSVRILDGDFIEGATETTGDGILLPLRADARIDLETIVGRLDTEYELSDGVPVPGSGSCEPTVLGFARLGSILTGNHL